MKNDSYTLEIANPVYPVTNAHGAVVHPGTQARKIVRLRTHDDFISDFNHAELVEDCFKPGDVAPLARELKLTPKDLLTEIRNFAKTH